MKSELDIKIALNDMLYGCFGENTRVYGREVQQGFIEPCFFTDVRLSNTDLLASGFDLRTYNIYINYFQNEDEYSEANDLKIVSKIRNYLIANDRDKRNPVLLIDGQTCLVESFSYDYVGDQNRLEIAFDLNLDQCTQEEDFEDDFETMSTIKLKTEI